MLTSFNLDGDQDLEEFRIALATFVEEMQQINLLDSAGPVLNRYRHEVLDTDHASRHDFCFILTFCSRDQCDAAVEFILSNSGTTTSTHKSAYSMISNPVFSCWEEKQKSSSGN